MKKHKGLTLKKSFLFHGLQQLSALIALTCAFLVLFYSFICVSYTSSPDEKEMIVFDLDLFSKSDRFEDTGTFDEMLMKSIKELIRFNVAKSQLETDGDFDGNKLIDIYAFVNRKSDYQNGVDDSYQTYSSDSLNYSLESLLKWEKYGISFDTIEMTESKFVCYFGNKALSYYDGILTEEERQYLNASLRSSSVNVDDVEGEYYLIDSDNTLKSQNNNTIITNDTSEILNVAPSITDDSELMIEKTEKEFYEITNVNKIHQALVAIMQETGLVNRIYYDRETGEIMVEINMMQERYMPFDGTPLIGHAQNWFSYNNMIDYLQQTIHDISYNYNEYLAFKAKYAKNVSNIKYTFKMMMMGQSVEVDNLDRRVADTGLDEYFKFSFGKYMIYRPQNMYFESNTGIISEKMLFEALNGYEYAYPESAKIWIAVDTDYTVKDPFSVASNIYSFMHPIIYLIISVGSFFGIIWLCLLLYLSVMTGYRKKTADGEVELIPHWFDVIPTELAFGCVIGIVAGAFIWLYNYLIDVIYQVVHYQTENRLLYCLFFGLISMLCSMLFCLFWYSFVRRIRTHLVWKNSILKFIFKNVIVILCRKIKKTLLLLFDNSNIWLRGFVYLGGVIVYNMFLGVFSYRILRSEGWKITAIFLLLGILIGDGIACSFWLINRVKRKKVVEGIGRIRDGELDYQIDLSKMHGDNKILAEAVNSIGAGIKTAVETSMKDERLKADLITNVSHDIKTPLTSIINYVNLLKRENIVEEPIKGYIDILESKSLRLKQLTEDLLEASKISSGNITLYMERINLIELLHQSIGEFSEKFEEKKLTVVEGFQAETAYIEADSRRIWRVIENLFNNIYKYALEGTRVYLDLEQKEEEGRIILSVKNISSQPLNIKADELTERFIRGDVSRSTEGTGLGLSIAKNLTELQHGKFLIYLDGDLFKITLDFPVYQEPEAE